MGKKSRKLKQKQAACAEEIVILLNDDNYDGDVVRVDIGDLEFEIGIIKKTSMFDTWRHIAGGFIIFALLVLYAYLFMLVMGQTDPLYLGTHM